MVETTPSRTRSVIKKDRRSREKAVVDADTTSKSDECAEGDAKNGKECKMEEVAKDDEDVAGEEAAEDDDDDDDDDEDDDDDDDDEDDEREDGFEVNGSRTDVPRNKMGGGTKRSEVNDPNTKAYRTHNDDTEEDIDTAQLKQEALIELERLSRNPNVFTRRKYSTRDKLADIQFEVRRCSSMLAEKHATVIMRQGLVFLTTGFEMANNRLGLLALDGWAKEVSNDVQRFDPALSALYRKHFNTMGVSPELELAIGLGGSAVSHHIQHRVQVLPKAKHAVYDDDEDIPADFTN